MDKTEEMAKEINEKIDGLKSQIEGSVTKDELKSANEALELFKKEKK